LLARTSNSGGPSL